MLQIAGQQKQDSLVRLGVLKMIIILLNAKSKEVMMEMAEKKAKMPQQWRELEPV